MSSSKTGSALTESLALVIVVALVAAASMTHLGRATEDAIAGAGGARPRTMAVARQAGTLDAIAKGFDFAKRALSTEGTAIEVRQTLGTAAERLARLREKSEVPRETRRAWIEEAKTARLAPTKTQGITTVAAVGGAGTMLARIALDLQGKSAFAKARSGLGFLYGYYLSGDLLYSMDHWFLDQYAANITAIRESSNPVLRAVYEAGEHSSRHHIVPRNVVGDSLAELQHGGAYENVLISALPGILAPMPPAVRSVFLGQLVAGLGNLWGHRVAHEFTGRGDKPRWLRVLEKSRAVVTDHNIHHSPPFNTHYGNVTGLTDGLTEKLFPALERQLFLRFRLVPSTWVGDPQLVPAEFWPLIDESPQARGMFERVAKESPSYRAKLEGKLSLRP